MKQVICRLSDELHEQLRRRAFEERVSIAQLIRRALEEKYRTLGISGIADKVIDNYQRDKDMLIQVLLDLQSRFGWLPQEALTEISKYLGVPLTRVYKAATFYKAFSLDPKGKHTLRVCMGTACQIRGAPLIRDRAQYLLGVEPGGTTPDMRFTFETVNCLGCCALGPVITVNGEYYGHISVSDAEKIIESYK